MKLTAVFRKCGEKKEDYLYHFFASFLDTCKIHIQPVKVVKDWHHFITRSTQREGKRHVTLNPQAVVLALLSRRPVLNTFQSDSVFLFFVVVFFRKPPVSPCNNPMRKRDMVMERMGCEQKWARMGVKAVMDPQAAADSRRTFSPPTLWTQHRHPVVNIIFVKKKNFV